jgi:uncharacterized protein YceH (UPF0502 family)
MSPEDTPPDSSSAPEATQTGAAADSSPTWPALTPVERRILGVLVEKQKTSKTADAYPLTLNALVTGCNQKSNRDPVVQLDDSQVEEGLTALQQKGLVERVTGGRAERAELLLRGPQTRGELRSRAGRMDTIDTLEALDEILKSLSARRLVTYLSDPHRRGALATHGFHSEEELQQIRSHAPASFTHAHPEHAAPSAAATDLARLQSEIDVLKERTRVLEEEVDELKRQLGSWAAPG